MRYLGIDYGEKHVGVAVSNEDGTMAFPHSSLSNTSKLIEELQTVIAEKEVGAIVIGESKDYRGKENVIMEKARAFATELEARTNLPLHFEPEFMTSTEARLIQGGGEKTHASAAALILKSFLGKKQNGLQ
jgi:putative Holliday junction resolvase